jgi:hypothetical protein
MTYFETAKLLVRIGAILGIILGIIEIVYYAFLLIIWLPWLAFVGFSDILWIGLGVMSVICSFLVYTVYYPKMDEDAKGIAIYLIIFGVLMMIGAWGIGGLLVLIGGILVFIESSESA